MIPLIKRLPATQTIGQKTVFNTYGFSQVRYFAPKPAETPAPETLPDVQTSPKTLTIRKLIYKDIQVPGRDEPFRVWRPQPVTQEAFEHLKTYYYSKQSRYNINVCSVNSRLTGKQIKEWARWFRASGEVGTPVKEDRIDPWNRPKPVEVKKDKKKERKTKAAKEGKEKQK